MTGTSGDNSSGYGRQPDEERGRTFKQASQTLRPEAGTPPPKRSRRARSQFVVFFNFVFSSIVFLVVLAGFAFYFGKREFHQPGPSSTAETVLIKPNTGVNQIASLLEREGVISDARIFSIGVRAYGADSELKAGEYAIDARASMHDVMELLKSGKSVLYSLTIPEGRTVVEVFQRIQDTPELSGKLPDEMPPEGSLAADTLRFTRGMDRTAVVEKLLEDQRELVDSIWERRDEGLPVKDKNEFVTLASIVEKETGIADERPRVAAVFINRLNKGMRLQSDPTIIYGLFGGQGKPADRPIYRSDIDKKTPYNTYQIDGLPPTPIANPGRAALEAVANPSQTDELYFVADGTGGHAFAKTLKEHNENVARWRKLERERQTEDEAGSN
ncbi:endolytic transglycosylase MltG [Nitratireductor aquimarinus]|uniref:Endolytic murein transglycosylase n=1 Tax=Nitratireductor aquimarinus TaxID=889300 RepID=A0ABU4AJV3_9HYPH|nr:endolytic transglycosylase MltG [Nitratireductor aquimarinus]MDV6226416.1 endolytic transglycosylase MltG [Nitratireductor aquimarinus]